MSALEIVSINPPIRGSIGYDETLTVALEFCINPPIRGSIAAAHTIPSSTAGINPPIRGSIEQDNALFRNYNHKR